MPQANRQWGPPETLYWKSHSKRLMPPMRKRGLKKVAQEHWDHQRENRGGTEGPVVHTCSGLRLDNCSWFYEVEGNGLSWGEEHRERPSIHSWSYVSPTPTPLALSTVCLNDFVIKRECSKQPPSFLNKPLSSHFRSSQGDYLVKPSLWQKKTYGDGCKQQFQNSKGLYKYLCCYMRITTNILY